MGFVSVAFYGIMPPLMFMVDSKCNMVRLVVMREKLRKARELEDQDAAVAVTMPRATSSEASGETMDDSGSHSGCSGDEETEARTWPISRNSSLIDADWDLFVVSENGFKDTGILPHVQCTPAKRQPHAKTNRPSLSQTTIPHKEKVP
jgi:hypothetical protein